MTSDQHTQNKPNASKPNILFICTDQQHLHMMSCAGNSYLKTPAIDRLAANGVRFTRAYCTNPVCVPSRFSLFTGRMPSAIGMRSNSSHETAPYTEEYQKQGLGHCLRAAGYETVYGGKEHFPQKIRSTQLGFEYLCQDERDDLAALCADWLKQKHEQPFAMVASLINPHDICYMAIKAFATSEQDDSLLKRGATEVNTLEEALKIPSGISEEEFWEKHCPPLPPNYEPQKDEPELIQFLLNQRAFKRRARDEWGEKEWRMHRWAYARLTEKVDQQIQIILDALDTAGLTDNTVIIFSSDHGDHDSSHRLEHKTILYNEAVNVPMIICDPRSGAHGTVDETHLVSNGMDLFPTICDYAGADMPKHITGLSLRPIAAGEACKDWRDVVYAENEISYMACTLEHKYVLYDSGEHREQLYDLVNDPHQTRNAAYDANKHAVLNTHQQLLAEQRTIYEKQVIA